MNKSRIQIVHCHPYPLRIKYEDNIALPRSFTPSCFYFTNQNPFSSYSVIGGQINFGIIRQLQVNQQI